MDEPLTIEDQVLAANLGDQTDLGAFDNEALDVLSELFDVEGFPDELLNGQGQKSHQQQALPQRGVDKFIPQHTQLPESPPYSSSEPYSPDRHSTLSPPSSDISSASCSMYPQQNPHPSQPQQTAQQLAEQQHAMQQYLLQQQQLQHQQQQLQQQQMQQHMHQQGTTRLLSVGNQQPQISPPQQQQVYGVTEGNALPNYTTAPQQQQQPKKRKYDTDDSTSDSSTSAEHVSPTQKIKQEPGLSAYELLAENSMEISPGMLGGGSYQPIKWIPFQKQTWFPVCAQTGHAVNMQTYRLDGDKGFNFSQPDKAFVCQKKNHFQITCCLSLTECPQYVRTQEGLKPIEGLFLHFYGAKEEAPNQIIQVDQSQSDRSKKKFCPVKLQDSPENSWKLTIGRLHFSDTTLNNMRKRGKPNPDQRYFLLVIGLFAHSQGREYPIIQQCSEKLIVRASNPGQFQDGEVEQSRWQAGTAGSTVYHNGNVGINTDTPDEALTVVGNVKVMGHIVQPSDKRVKEDITEVDTKDQMNNLRAINLYNYRYTEEFADTAGMDDTVETGVIAQELEVVIPEAVKTSGDVQLKNGEVIENLKVVDKNRLFMESLGAVKELCNVTDSLEHKIEYLEKFNKKLAKLKRLGSMRSTTSTDTDMSTITSISTLSRVTVKRKPKGNRKEGGKTAAPAEQSICSNKFLQYLIIILVLVMAGCVGVICAVLLLEKAENASTAQQPTDTGAFQEGPPFPNRIFTTDITNGPDLHVSSISPTASGCGKPLSPLMFGQPCADGTCSRCQKYCEHRGISGDGTAFTSVLDPDGTDPTGSPKFQDVTIPYQPHPEAGVPFHVVIGSPDKKKPASDGHVYQATLPTKSNTPQNKSSHQSSVSYSGNSGGFNPFNTRRRKRSIDDQTNNPLDRVKISFTLPIAYDLTLDNCLDCDKDCVSLEQGGSTCSNSTFVVQLHNSFVPGTYGHLNIERQTSNTDFVRIARCNSTDTLPRESCQSAMPPPPHTDTRPTDNNATFILQMGTHLESSVVLRIGTGLKWSGRDDLCTEPLSTDLKEISVWFIRVCSSCGSFKRGIKDRIYSHPHTM